MLAKGGTNLSNLPTPHRSPVMLADLQDDLLWPKLLRSWKLALAPGRVALGFLFVLLTFGVVAAYQGFTGRNGVETFVSSEALTLHAAVRSFGEPAVAAREVYTAVVSLPLEFLRSEPLALILVVPLLLAVWCVVGGAVCRSCACEVSLRAALPWRSAVGFGLRKTPALFAAIAGPVILVWLACFVLRVVGWVFFTSKVMGLAGSALLVVPLLFALVVGAAALAYLLAHVMLVPAVACEGTDSFDAVQRCYAYVLARPGRLVVYLVVALLAALPALLVAGLLTALAVEMTRSLVRAPVDEPLPFTEPAHWEATRVFTRVWVGLLVAVAIAYAVSLYFCAATNVYLVMRRLVDGQDIGELWTPGPREPARPPLAAPAATPAAPPITEQADYT